MSLILQLCSKSANMASRFNSHASCSHLLTSKPKYSTTLRTLSLSLSSAKKHSLLHNTQNERILVYFVIVVCLHKHKSAHILFYLFIQIDFVRNPGRRGILRRETTIKPEICPFTYRSFFVGCSKVTNKQTHINSLNR